MHLAAVNGHTDICSLIADHTLNPNPGDHCGNTPLHEAARGGHTEAYRQIMGLVQDKNPPADCGTTPLHLAAGNGHYDLTQLILDNVEDNTTFGTDSCTAPMDLAAQNGHWRVHSLFESKPTSPVEKSIWFFLPESESGSSKGGQTFFSCSSPHGYGVLDT